MLKHFFSKAYPFCAAVTCILPKSSSSSSVRFRLPVGKKRGSVTVWRSAFKNNVVSYITNVQIARAMEYNCFYDADLNDSASMHKNKWIDLNRSIIHINVPFY